MIKIDDLGETIVDWDDGSKTCTVWHNAPFNAFARDDPWNRITLDGVQVSGVHAKRLQAAVNTAMPDNCMHLRRLVAHHLIAQTTGEVAERILRACYD